MNPLFKSLVALVPAVVLLLAAGISFSRLRTVPALMQLLGAGAFVAVALCHLFEGLKVFPSMGWGQDHSLGHYIDLSSAALVSYCFPWATCYKRSGTGVTPDNAGVLLKKVL